MPSKQYVLFPDGWKARDGGFISRVDGTETDSEVVVEPKPPSGADDWGTARPDVIYGPNGTYKAPATPRYDLQDSTHRIEVDCSVSAVKTAIQSLTADMVANGVTLLIRPGILGSSTSTSSPTMGGLGDPTWTRRVQIRPRDERSSVTLGGNGYIIGCHNLTVQGMYAESIRVYGGSNVGWNRILLLGTGIFKCFSRADGSSGSTGSDMRGVFLGETVRREFNPSKGEDPGDVWTYQYDMVDPVFAGWHLAPNFRSEGSTHHTDTVQFEPYNGGTTNNARFIGIAAFGSSSTTIQINGIRGASFERCYLIGHSFQNRYPQPSYEQGAGTALNGAETKSNTDHMVSSYDSVFMGGHTATVASSVRPYREVVNSVSSETDKYGFIFKPGIHDSTYPNRPPAPTDTYLNEIWGK